MEIHLRNLRLQDLEQMVKWEKNKDPLFADYNFPTYSLREQKLWYHSKTRYGKICLAILNENNVIGYISIRKLNPISKSAEMGIIIRPLYQNMGVGELAISRMLSWFFGEFGYKKMTLYVGKYNKKALYCYDKLGFKPLKELYMSFENEEVDLDLPEYADIERFFKIKNGKIMTLCLQMAIEKDSSSYKERFS